MNEASGNFEWNKAYRDLITEIEICEIRQSELQGELRVLNRRIYGGKPRSKLVASYLGMPGGGGNQRPTEETWEVYQAVTEALEDIADILSLKKEAKQRMEAKMSQFDTLEYRVAYLRDIERLPIAAIAMRLGYSYDWIAKISSKIKRVRKTA